MHTITIFRKRWTTSQCSRLSAQMQNGLMNLSEIDRKAWVECVLPRKKSWMFVTYIDAFIQEDKEVDDCALLKTRKYDELLTTASMEKNVFRDSWKEVVIQWGEPQFLAQASFCLSYTVAEILVWNSCYKACQAGERGSSSRKAFLGLALPSAITHESFWILSTTSSFVSFLLKLSLWCAFFATIASLQHQNRRHFFDITSIKRR